MKNGIYIFFALVVASSCTSEKYKNLNDGLYAEIQTNKGNIFLELYATDAPMTVANFISLAEGTNTKVLDSFKGKKYYDGLTFHRVVPNFIIQGGDPTALGTGTAGYRFGDEFIKDENGKLLHSHNDAGMLSMANSGPERNSSQFFITHRAIPHLNGKHTVFGKVILDNAQLNSVKKQAKDSKKLKNAIDSIRMVVVNSIQQADTILSIKIIRLGDKAASFDAPTIFENELIKYTKSKKDRAQKEIEADIARYAKYLENKAMFSSEMNESKAVKTDSGLGILMLKRNPKGEKVVDYKPIKTHFTIYTADGKKIQSTEDSGEPFVFQLNDASKPMITGFEEGVSTLKVGEKARLFIPYYIGYGEAKYGPFPAKSDLVFEVEILEINK
ncbi:peptidylprolyl isomerase [Polaribacter glomeratus]|uniref:peptidylprolyl isomerase n=1 Tax=Polaribacter glomeratus TaxID=102 RepID=A0A2S7WWZ8_9FLAO|nr:peptidylprolyl isomerase [Polaribacter glomeratus]PQJ82130.1 peptidylprolyl isomerase [Polaribacter glomeratus]TXD66725.1 peptidylprolyl isomerase [Polaribacter glomeratus]